MKNKSLLKSHLEVIVIRHDLKKDNFRMIYEWNSKLFSTRTYKSNFMIGR